MVLKPNIFTMETKPYIIKFSEEVGLLHIQYVGNLTADNIIASMKDAKQNYKLPGNLLVISDFRKAETKLKIKELPKLVKPTLEVIRNHKSVYNALIFDRPYGTALLILFMDLIKKSNTEYKVFTTIEAAQEWLLKAKI